MQLSLFESNKLPSNILPCDGQAVYFGKIIPHHIADEYYQQLWQNILWQSDEAHIFGKHIITKRKVAWYGSRAFDYTYSKITKKALPFTDTLQSLKALAEKTTGATYNSCLLNLYHNGNEGMAYHSDGEPMLLKNGSIASLSFGAERKFLFRHKSQGQTISIWLQHGSLLEMKGPTQLHWLHRLPTTTQVHNPRINLTFRTIVD